MQIDAKTVAQLRAATGAGIVDVKNALVESGGDAQMAVEVLRKKGIAKAGTKAERVTREGRVHSYIHSNGKVGVLVEVLCETDFVARNEKFIELCHSLAMHIAAASPLYVSRDQAPTEIVEKERELFKAETLNEGKPENILEKIVDGRMEKYFNEIILLEQEYIKDPDMTISDLINDSIAKIGENIQVRGFCRFAI